MARWTGDSKESILSCANIIVKGFSNDQLAFSNDNGLANTTCHWNTGVMWMLIIGLCTPV
jgi:hypothetical protein